MQFSRFFTSPFDDEGYSLDEINSYTGEHLASLIANNPGGVFAAIIAATASLFTALGGTLATEQSKLGVQMARTQAKANFRAALSNELSKIHGAALGKFGRKGVEMTALFPSGLESFGDATDERLATNLEALDQAISQQPALDAATKTLAHTLATTWSGLSGASETGKANKGTAADQRRAANKALRAQLFVNLLTLAMQFPGQPEKAALYCPQHLLEDQTAKPAAAAATPPTQPPKL